MIPAPAVGGTPQSGYFVIADISGYTRFVAENDLEHAHGVLHDLITLVIEELGAPLQFVELEGDAVFVYAPESAVHDAERLLDAMEACYAAFRMRVEQMLRNTTCACSACRAVRSLDLKCVAHYGRYATQRTPTGVQLVGADVTLAHLLLKNRVIEATGIRAYALLSEAFVAKAAFARDAGADGPAALGLPLHEEQIEPFGTVRTRVLDLAACVERHQVRFRDNLDARPVGMEIVTPMPASARVVWGHITEPALRPRWQQDIRGVRSVPAANGRTDIGWQSHCDHGGYVMEHRIVDWRPFERITMHTRATGTSLTTPPPCQADFLFEDLPDGTCVLRFHVRLREVGWFTRAMFRVVRPMVRREWSGHFRRLQEVVASDPARQRAAAAPHS